MACADTHHNLNLGVACIGAGFFVAATTGEEVMAVKKEKETNYLERLVVKIQTLGNELSNLCEEVVALQKYCETMSVTTVKHEEMQVKGLDGELRVYQDPPERLLRLKDVLKVFSISKSTFWAGIKSGRYPAPSYVLGPKIPTWRLSEIMQLVKGEE